jgi:hypothetical protein
VDPVISQLNAVYTLALYSFQTNVSRMPSSGIWRRLDLVWTDISEEHIASIFRVEKYPRARNQREQVAAGWFLAHGYFSTLKMVETRSSETSVHKRSTRRHIPKDGIIHSHCSEILKSYIMSILFSYLYLRLLYCLFPFNFRNKSLSASRACVLHVPTIQSSLILLYMVMCISYDAPNTVFFLL